MAALINSANISASVESMVANLMACAFTGGVQFIAAGLHDGRMQIQVVRHDGGAQNADRDVKHAGIGNDLRRRHESFGDPDKVRPGERSTPRQNIRQ